MTTGLVCGSNSGIGLALVHQLLNNNDFDLIFATHRKESSISELLSLKKNFPSKLKIVELNPKISEDYKKLAHNISEVCSSIDLLINCIGFLHNDQYQPEKSITQVSQNSIIESIQINTSPTLFLAKHLKHLLLSSKNSIFTSISAKVGSIDDNKTGGWYSYRLSKAALNMCLKNISIEFNQPGKTCTVLSIHPGTTDSKMSQPFLKFARKKYKIHSTAETAHNILKILLSSDINNHNGKFLSWDGAQIQY